MSFLILMCERCADDGMFRAGVYRDLRGQTLCEACDTELERAQPERADYGRPNEPEVEGRRKSDRLQEVA